MSINNSISRLNKNQVSKRSNEFFLNSYQKLLDNDFTTVNFGALKPLSDIPNYDDLQVSNERSNNPTYAVVKLNGGLGTSFNSRYPKSTIPFFNDQSILNILLNNVSKSGTPLVLLNSPYTHQYTHNVINASSISDVTCMVQSKFPRLLLSDFLPYNDKLSVDNNWNPIGHGEVFFQLYESGILHEFINRNINYLFISNIDNIFSSFSEKILNHMIQNDIDFLMEVTPKLLTDQKGGILVQENHKIRLIEIAQVAHTDIDHFQDLSKFRFFNTNNIWVNIKSLIESIETDSLKLDVIYNHKRVNDTEIIQIESAMGSAIQSFNKSQLISVPRSRFFPIKTINDIFYLKSFYCSKTNKFNLPPYLFPIDVGSSIESVTDFLNDFDALPCFIDCNHFYLNGPFTSHKSSNMIGSVKLNTNEKFELGSLNYYENCLIYFD